MRHAVLALAVLVPVALAVAQESEGEKKEGKPVTSPAGLVMTGQPGWEAQKPKSNMRAAEWKLPRAEKDDRDGELVVYFFSGGGGGVEDNVKRWLGQFTQPDGKATADVAKRETKELAGMKVHLLDVSGTFVAETRPGSGEKVNQPGSRMLAAIVEAPKGMHYFKLVGPAATVEKWKDSFQKFLEALKQEG